MGLTKSQKSYEDYGKVRSCRYMAGEEGTKGLVRDVHYQYYPTHLMYRSLPILLPQARPAG